MRLAPLVVLLSLASAIAAQESRDARFRIGLAFGGGEFDFQTDGSGLDGDEDAGFFRLQFEATSGRGIGGGIRFESLATDDELFLDAGFPASEAANGTIFGHFTYRFESHRFAMPIRFGLFLNGLSLTENVSDDEVVYGSIGPYLEIAPELTLVRSRSVRWSLFAEGGIGVGGTAIDIEDDSNEYQSSTAFAGLELGTRLQLGPVELGVSYLGRWQSMEESDPEGVSNLVVLPYDAEFQGLLVSFAVVF